MLTRYDQAASRAAAQVMGQYSTSFSLATRLLRGRVRADIRHLYAVVRIADELVDDRAEAAEGVEVEVDRAFTARPMALATTDGALSLAP